MSDTLSKEQLNYFKNRLLEMKEEVEEKLDEDQSTSPNDDIQTSDESGNHPADTGSEQFEQEKEAGFGMMQENELQEIEAALERIEEGNYGFSEKSGKPIPIERLEAMPTARKLVEEDDES